jgi:hypothetical protein
MRGESARLVFLAGTKCYTDAVLCTALHKTAVAPLVGARIETHHSTPSSEHRAVAPLVGARIET